MLEFLGAYLTASTSQNSALDIVIPNAKYYRLVVEEAAYNVTRKYSNTSLDEVMASMTSKFDMLTQVCIWTFYFSIFVLGNSLENSGYLTCLIPFLSSSPQPAAT